jgi:hypothetical protein
LGGIKSLDKWGNIVSGKKYLLLFDVDAWKRHYHITEFGKIIKFVVPLEVRTDGVWKEVIRCDCSHDYVHKDCYNIKGQRKKINLNLNYEDSLTLADDDINENWKIYREKYLEGRFP